MRVSDFQRMRVADERPRVEVGDLVEFADLPRRRYEVAEISEDEVVLLSGSCKVRMAKVPANMIIHKKSP